MSYICNLNDFCDPDIQNGKFLTTLACENKSANNPTILF